jgi:ADP-dependent NAD(P)H-hydrate dehydratase / NAD(P)H-hydrate epimerase
MKILNAEQTRLADAHTIAHEPIASIDLMERAANSFVDAFCGDYGSENKVIVVCGTGNNGGDGLAISRILLGKGYLVDAYVIQPKEGGSEDFETNLARIEPLLSCKIINDEPDIPSFKQYHVIIDAIFGSGLTRKVTGLYAEVISAINASSTDVVAVDIPSGLYVDEPPEPDAQGAIIEADSTISFQVPKLSFFMPENYQYVGRWEVVDIGLNQDFITQQESDFSTIEHAEVEKFLPPRSKFSHKGSFGHGQLFGGSYGKMGAITLAAEAFLRSGAGLLTVTIPASGTDIMQTTVPEAMVLAQPGEKLLSAFNISPKAVALGVGPGLGQAAVTAQAFGDFLRNNTKPLVLDADALNILSDNQELLSLLPPDTIITPHLKEFDRLAGPSDNNWERLAKARAFSRQHQLITVLKGAHTAVINKDGKVKFNTTGNPGMATAGSGDVLLGIVTSLRTQGLAGFTAAVVGTYIHGCAGDDAASKLSMSSLLASDIIAALTKVFLKFLR